MRPAHGAGPGAAFAPPVERPLDQPVEHVEQRAELGLADALAKRRVRTIGRALEQAAGAAGERRPAARLVERAQPALAVQGGDLVARTDRQQRSPGEDRRAAQDGVRVARRRLAAQPGEA